MNDRRTFLVQGRSDLDQIIQDAELLEEVRRPVVVMTASVDFENAIDGWTPNIKRAAKRQFLAFLRGSFSKESTRWLDMEPDDITAFDRYFELHEIDYLEIGSDEWLTP